MISSDCSITIDYSILLGYPCSLTITSWKNGIACFGRSGDETTEFNRFLDDPCLPFNDILNSPEAQCWLETFPPDLLPILDDCHIPIYPLLWLLSRYQSAIDLFISSPLLMSIILHCAKIYNWSEAGTVGILSQKRVYIIERCKLGGGKPLLKLINKLSMGAVNHETYRLIQELLELPKWQAINHLKYTDERLLRLVIRYPELLSSRLLQSYHKDWEIGKFHRFYSDTLRMATLEHEDRVLNCRTPDELEGLHERYIIEINKNKRGRKIEYHLPPIPRSQYILPITDSIQLYNEGKIQEHCVFSYHDDIIKKSCYIYKVMQPERATVEISTPKNGEFSIVQIRLHHNNVPSKETVRCVQEWLNDYKQGQQKKAS